MLKRILGQCWHCGQRGIYYCGCCAVCFADLPRTPPQNLRPGQAPDYCRTWLAALFYQPPVDHWVSQYKFHSHYGLADDFALLLSGQVLAFHRYHKRLLPSILIPVPMSHTRWRRRGYNQAKTLCQAVSKVLGIPYLDVLDINPAAQAVTQHQLSARQREQAMGHRYRLRTPVRAAHVALIDDVITTGSTLNAAAIALLEGGVDEVSGWALAYTPASCSD